MRAFAAAALVLQFLWAGVALSCSLPQPKGEVVLTVGGFIGECNVGLEAQFDMAMIETLPRTVVKTENPWEQGLVTYEGVLLRDLLAYVKADGRAMDIMALNDYRTSLPVADAETYDVILAYKREGSYMSVREKGPLFVVFPFSDVPSLASEERYGQSVWQVSRITLE